MEYSWAVPDTPLFDVTKAKRLLDVTIRQSLERMTGVVKTNVQLEAPLGASKQLRNSIGTSVSGDVGKVFTGVDYAGVVEEGRTPGKQQPPSDALVPWLRRSVKGKSLYRSMKQKNKKITYKSAAFALAKSIKKKGIKANAFFDRGIDKSSSTVTKIGKALLKTLARAMA